MRRILTLLIVLLATVYMLAGDRECRIDSMISFDIRHGLPESRVRSLYALSDGRLAVVTAGYLTFFDGTAFRSVPVEYGKGMDIESIGKNRIVFHDKEGRLWIKTPSTRNDDRSRVNVFDVKTGEDVTKDVMNRIGFSDIRGVYGDEAGGVWIIDQDNNLSSILDFGNQKSVSLESIGRDIPQWLSVRDGKIYLLYADGKVCVMRRESGTIEFMTFPPLAGKEWRLINSAVKWHDGRLWLSFYIPGNGDEGLIAVLDTEDGGWSLRRFNEIVNDFFISHEDSMIYRFDGLEEEISCVLPDGKDGIWIGTVDKGLRFVNPRRLRLTKHCATSARLPRTGYYPTERCYENGLKYADGSVNASAEDRVTGFVYLATRKGLFVIDGNDRLLGVIDKEYGLPHSNIQGVITGVPRNNEAADSIGDIWLATATGLSRLRYLSDDGLQIINIGLLDGLDLDGKEFISQSMSLDSCGVISVAYPGGYCFIDSKSVCDRDYVVYRFPYQSDGMLSNPSAKSRIHPVWWILGVVILFGIFCVCLLRNKRVSEKKVEVDSVSEASVTDCSEHELSESGSGSVSVGKICDNLVSKVREESSAQSEEVRSSVDQEFENRLNGIIYGHLDDENLNVVTLSSMMAMDRTNLYRRMQSVFGLAPSIYIRNIRLEAACRLLKETEIPIAEVAMRVGFSSAKYFSSSFKDKYGILPSKFRVGSEQ